MKKGLTELVFILDKSGSMCGLEADTIGGFNSMIEKQKNVEGEVFVSTVLFDNESTVIHDRLDIKEVPKLTQKEYSVGGCTALLDAIGGAIQHIGNIHKYAREEDVPEHTLFVITTDGMENASISFGYSDIKKKIEKQKTKYGWEFLFLGANIDAVEVGEKMGIQKNRVAAFCNDREGIACNYEVLSNAIHCMREPMGGAICDNWADEIKTDYDKRKTKKK